MAHRTAQDQDHCARKAILGFDKLFPTGGAITSVEEGAGNVGTQLQLSVPESIKGDRTYAK